jgi:hypothetical protein
MKKITLIMTFWFFVPCILAQTDNFTTTRTEVYFNRILRDWDGFGFNYVEEAQYRDIEQIRQDYGGFSYLAGDKRQEILELVFGENGLKPGLVKTFLDPFHQSEPGGLYDHRYSASNMLYFVKEGYRITCESGRDFQIITTLYGPPAYMTRQKIVRGRDFDEDHKEDLVDYLVDWARFLTVEKNLPLRYISLHNEGEDWQRWPEDGGDHEDHYNHDYNMYWSPELVVEFLEFLPGRLKKAGIRGVGVTPGEYFGWDRFADYGYARAIAENKKALENLALITSHGFSSWGWGRWNTYHTSVGNDLLRHAKPGLKSWVTSTSWSSMDTEFIRQIYGNIYVSKVNAIIPWAGIQRPGLWIGGDPNSGSAFHVFEDGTYKVRKGYYFYKQVCRAGQPGMGIAEAISMDAEVKIIAFASNKTQNPDAFVVINMGNYPKSLNILIEGTSSSAFEAYRSLDNEQELHNSLGKYTLENQRLRYEAPAKSVTTFYGM